MRGQRYNSKRDPVLVENLNQEQAVAEWLSTLLGRSMVNSAQRHNEGESVDGSVLDWGAGASVPHSLWP